jgi:hypothetical protein
MQCDGVAPREGGPRCAITKYQAIWGRGAHPWQRGSLRASSTKAANLLFCCRDTHIHSLREQAVHFAAALYPHITCRVCFPDPPFFIPPISMHLLPVKHARYRNRAMTSEA